MRRNSNWIRGLLVCAIVFGANGLQAQPLVALDFNDNGLDNSWAIEGDTWALDDPYTQGGQGNLEAPFLTFAAYFYGSGPNGDTLTSPWVTIAAVDGPLTLQWHEYYFFKEEVGSLSVEVTTGGNIWEPLRVVSSGESVSVGELVSLDLSAFLGIADSLRIRFRAMGLDQHLWALDNIRLLSGDATPPKVSFQPQAYHCTGNIELPLSATDESGIGAVSLVYQWSESNTWDTLTVAYPSTPILSPPTDTGRLHYRWIVTDASLNQNTTYLLGPSQAYSLRYGAISSAEYHQGFEQNSTTSSGLMARIALPPGDRGHLLRAGFYEANAGDTGTAIFGPILLDEAFPTLRWQRAYAGYEGLTDTLSLSVSPDLGRTWEPANYRRWGSLLATVPPLEPYFVPQLDDFRYDSVYLGDYANQCILVRLEGKAGGGNNLYLDDFHFTQSLEAGLTFQFHKVFPNPTDGDITMEGFSSEIQPITIYLHTVQGAQLFEVPLGDIGGWFSHTLDLSTLPRGTYIISMAANGQVESKLVIVRK